MYDLTMGDFDPKTKKLFLLDMDGTIYLDNTMFPGALEFLDGIKKNGGRYVFLTNNSSKSVDAYVEKMLALDVHCYSNDFLTSIDCLIEKLADKKNQLMYIMGTQSFVDQMRDNGFNVISELEFERVEEGKDYEAFLESKIEIVVLGFDRELTFSKLDRVCRVLSKGQGKLEYYATNPDWVCPTEYGSVPDCGSFAQIIETATGFKPKFIGKPEPDMVEMAMKKFGVSKEETVVIGDRIYTDIASGVNAGVDTVFVLSGEGVENDIEKYGVKPTWILDSIAEINW